MKAPFFWYQSQGFFSSLLLPLGWLYGRAGKIRSASKKTKRFEIPIISIGNIVCGGAGKTPTAIALAQLLQERGYTIHFVTRGYGGKEKGPLLVTPSHHIAEHVGDEALLLAQHAPTWVAKKRSDGVQKAIEKGAQLIILDDGHQTTGLYKDVSLVVVDLFQGFGNGCVIPAGPLREDLSGGLKRADGFIGIGKGTVKGLQPFFKAKSVPHPLTLPTKRVIAFCGLGFPQKFYMSLETAGFELVLTDTFPDHYQYTNDDLLSLQKLAHKHDSALITTRKDWVKIPPSWQKQLHVLDISIEFEDSEKICEFILQKIIPLGKNV